ncbi:indole-3-acetic acid-amido synthetase GH3.17-like isoform X2 [Asparagus officinalis]|uniref:indole-3-acetic acid-amido synthetase GH3.17-like isoform X2 n=1 Tax=Asparagus officinalis TaxID=4686 RepID=UPI00098E144C|nr:indole-3-acetic acid-amido synthetase GH3.17-like isoform X2 [Asparagus officinalis]
MLFECDPNDGESTIKLIENLTTNASRIQQQVLDEIIARNSGTEYLKAFLHGNNTSRDLFKKRVPVVEYEQVKPYIDRIANGEPSSIVSAHPITELLTSSGTSGGQPKMMPSTAEELDRKTFLYDIQVPVVNQYVPGLDEGKGMYLYFIKPEIPTKSGLPARPVLTSYYKSPNFRNRRFNKYNIYTSPDETILCADSKQSMYCQLLCGLVQRDEVLRVGAVFASAFLRAIKFLENYWKEMCANIRTGELSSWIADETVRTAVLKIMSEPNPELAGEIEKECRLEPWEGIVKRLWPRTKYVDVIVTGSMAQYIPLLDLYSGGLPLVSTMYASSECYFGINMKPLNLPSEVSYTLLPNMAFFEFIPVEREEEAVAGECNGIGGDGDGRSPVEVVDLVDVQVGKYYELVVTTFTGLYRYRVGDILQVAGFHNRAPQFRFVHRRNVVLSVDTDKTNEGDLLNAITAAKRRLLHPLRLFLTEYTSYADTSSIPGHYVLFWEISPSTTMVDASVIEECCSVVEALLDSVYRRCRRKDRSIGPLEIRVVECGAFDALMDLCVSQGSSVNQYKTPRCVKSPEAIRLLNERVVGRFFSKKTPEWEPCRIGAM